jgi:hypothetical protein
MNPKTKEARTILNKREVGTNEAHSMKGAFKETMVARKQ